MKIDISRPYPYYIRLHWRSFTLGLIALLFTNALDAIAPLLIGMAIDGIITGRPFGDVAQIVGIVILVTLALAVCRFLWRLFWGRFHHTVAEDLRNRLFAKMTELGPTFFSRQTTGGLMSLINNDVNSFRMAVGPGLLILFDSIFILLMVPVLMWKISPDWTWRCLILMPTVPFIVRSILRRTEQAYRAQQMRFAEMSGAAQEIVAGIRVIKSYAQENNQTRLFNVFSRRYADATLNVAKIDAAFGPALEIAAAAGSVILLLVGSGSLVSGAVTVGQIFAFYQYIQKMVWPMEGIGISFSHFQVGKAAFQRILDTLNQPLDVPDLGSEKLSDIASLEVKNLNFTYPGASHPTLKNINFELKKGEILGVVGATGSGKTTLADVLCRLYPTTAGAISVNSIPIENIQLENFRSLISMVPQDTYVFSRQVGENILFGHLADPGYPISEAARWVKLDEEVEAWPDGYATLIGERGVNLSGGQRQRVTLARALIRQSPLIIIDDALSAVDAKTAKSILENLRLRLREGSRCAAIVISHRLGHVAWTDRVLVMNNGQVEALGRPEEVLRQSPTYQRLHALQTQEAMG